MHKILSSHLFVRHRLTTVWLERIATPDSTTSRSSAPASTSTTEKAQIKELGHWFSDSGLKVWSLSLRPCTTTRCGGAPARNP